MEKLRNSTQWSLGLQHHENQLLSNEGEGVHMLITCVVLMMIDVVMQGQGRHLTNHEIFASKTLLSAILYWFWGCCFGNGGSMVLVYDYLELYGANAQKTY